MEVSKWFDISIDINTLAMTWLATKVLQDEHKKSNAKLEEKLSEEKKSRAKKRVASTERC